MKAWIVAHPVAGFVLLAFGISYLLGIPFLVFASGAIPPHLPLSRLYAPRLLIVYGPAMAALIMTSARGQGLRPLLSKVVPSRSDLAAAAVIVSVGMATAAGSLLFAGVTAVGLWATVHANGGLLVAHFILQLLCIGIGEELGWRGWLLPVLAPHRSRLHATLVTAAVWTLWHGPRLIDRPFAVLLFAVAVFGLSFLFTWIWSHAGHRLFPVVVAHATVNAPMFFWEHTGTLSPDRLTSAWVTLHTVYTILAVALVIRRWEWWMDAESWSGFQERRSSYRSLRGE